MGRPFRIRLDWVAGSFPVDILHRYYEDLLGIAVPPWQCDELLAEAQSAEFAVRAQIGHPNDIGSSEYTMLNAALLAPFVGPIDARESLMAMVGDLASAIGASTQSVSTASDGPAWLDLLTKASAQWPVLTPMSLVPGETLLFKTREVRKSGDRNSRVFDTGPICPRR